MNTQSNHATGSPSRRGRIGRCRGIGAIFCLAFGLASCGSPQPKNVVLLIVDDLGWADTGIYGSSFHETPHIDQLAMDGVRFTNFYAASPVCSPTRASIMTGHHPARVKITNWIGGEQKGQLLQADYRRELPLDEITLAERFQMAGYATAFIGKWHLGSDGYLPQNQGFDINIGGHDAGQPGSYFYPYRHPSNAYWNVPDLDEGEEGEYLTDRLTDESLAFLRENAENPFLLVLSYYNVHTPLQAKESLTAIYDEKKNELGECPQSAHSKEQYGAMTKRCQDHSVYAAMIHSTDESVGRIRAELNRLNLSERTALVFVSDNGGLSTLSRGRTTAPTANDPLRSGKGWLYEGGIRIPFIVTGPGIEATGQVRHVPAMTTDIGATIQDLAGLPESDAHSPDAVSLLPILERETNHDPLPEERALFWHFPHYHGSANRPSGAVRVGPFKLIEWFEDGRTELYNLETDPSERADLSASMPEKAAELLSRLRAWREEVDAEMPTPNPDWTGN